MSDDQFARIAKGLVRAASMSADELAAKKGENDLFVRIKRNSERLQSCDRHEFEPQPDWQTPPGSVLSRKVRCRRCGGEMSFRDAHTYLRGFAHGSGQSYAALADEIWPPSTTPEPPHAD